MISLEILLLMIIAVSSLITLLVTTLGVCTYLLSKKNTVNDSKMPFMVLPPPRKSDIEPERGQYV